MNTQGLNLFKKMRSVVFAAFLFGFYSLLSRLWFIRHLKRPTVAGSCLYAHWHGDELLLIGSYAWNRMAVMVSRSQDGEMLRILLGWLGFHVVRGSSSKGGAGRLKGLIDAVEKDGFNASLAVDGPRGPIYEVKPGILKLAQATGKPLVPGAASASFRYVFRNAWNRCYLPLPFSRGVIVYGEPMFIPKELSEEEFENHRLKLEKELMRLKSEAEATYDRFFLRNPIPVRG